MTFWEGSPGIIGMPVYNSVNLTPSVWGAGWSSDMDHYATLNGDASVTITDGAGAQLSFFRKADSTGVAPVYTSPLGTFLTLTATVGSNHNVTALSERDSDGSTLIFATPGGTGVLRQTQLIDRNGNTIDYTRDSQGRLTRVQDVHGRYFNITYNSVGKVGSLSDSGGRTVTFSYDSNGNRTSESGPEGATGYSYDANHLLTRVTYPNNGVTNYTYDSQKRLITEDDGGVDAVTFTRNPNSTIVTDAVGNQTKYDYITQSGFSVTTKITDPANNVTSFSYDSNLNLVSATDAVGRTYTYTYDSLGNATSAQDPAGKVNRAAYEPVFSQPTTLTDPLNRSLQLSYDSKGNLTQVNDPTNHQTSISYDIFGHVTQIQDPLGHVSLFTYKAANGALSSIKDPLSRSAHFQTDELSRETSVTDPAGENATFSYDSAGDLTSLKDSLGSITRLNYQAGRNGNIQSQITDPNQHSISFQYDMIDRLIGATNALGQNGSATYDTKSRLRTTTSRNGFQTTLDYDNLDRLYHVTIPEGTLTISYDAVGNITSLVKYNGSAVALIYDVLDRVVQEVQTLPNGHIIMLGYTYDANGNRTKMTTPWGDFTYTYDQLNRPTVVKNPSGKAFSFDYDAGGRRTTLTYPNGVQTSYTYDAASQITGIQHKRLSDGMTLAFDNYTYDSAGNRLTMIDAAGTHTYTYDSGHRLTSAKHPASSLLPVKQETFSYDPAHNRTSDAVITAYVYDVADRLQSNSSYTYTNDADGNRLSVTGINSNSQTHYTWDASDELTRVVRPDGTQIDYSYDVMGRVVEMTVTTTTVTTTYFVRDGADIVATLDGSNNLTSLYTHSGVGREPLSLTRNGTDYYLHADVLSSVVAASDSSGQIQERIDYSTYGQPVFSNIGLSTASASFIGDIYAYTGAEWAAEIGLSRHGIRYLDVQVGRWISEEPFGFDGTNRYWYAGDNPNKFVDRSGAFLGTTVGTVLAATEVAGATSAVVMFGIPVIVAGLLYIAWEKGTIKVEEQNRAAEESLKPKTSTAGGGRRKGPKGPPPPKCILPTFKLGGKTSGTLKTPNGDVDILSGKAGPAQGIPLGTRGFDAYLRTHVEGHAAAYMRQNGLTSATLFINNPVICNACLKNLSRVLAPGSTLTVILPDGTSSKFTGEP